MKRARTIINVLLVVSSSIIACIIYNKVVINGVSIGLHRTMDMTQTTGPDNEHADILSRVDTHLASNRVNAEGSSTNNTMKSMAYNDTLIVNNSTIEEIDHKIMDTQQSRINTINYVCKNFRNIGSVNRPLQGIVYISSPLFYCNVAKLGSEFLKAFFPMSLQSIGKDARKERIPTETFSFLNVGDPYERLYSGYKDKLFKPNMDFWPTVGTDVVRTVRQNKNRELCSGCDVTFREIVEYVITCHEKGIVLNLHFEPIHKQCNPCERRFNFISRKETLSSDLVDLFDILHEKSIVKDEVSVQTLENAIRYKQKISEGSIKKLFAARETYPSMSAYKLFQRHWSTYHIGGYILNQYEMPFSTSEVKTATLDQYEKVLIKAMDKSRDHRDQLKLQRHEALVQAYRSVPSRLLAQLREFMKPDCMLFSYDDEPDYIFHRDTYNDSITHTYMKGL